MELGPEKVNLKKRASGVLIVDDLSFMRTAIRDILQKNGIKVAGEAENGRRCLEFYYRHPVDLVLLDITMPEMDGIEALRRLVKLDKNVKVIMCSAMGQEKYILRAIQLGAKDFIVKPFKAERIISAVRKAVGLNEE